MKTNKEIKPFKMRCESVAQFNKVKIILTENNISQIAASGNRDLLINAYLKDDVLVYTTFERHFNEPEPELTYSEFMKLYGDEEEVFTRDDMIEFAYGALCSLSHSSTEEDVEHLLTAYLSTRAND